MERINGSLLKQMLESGMNNLSNHAAEVDALNVFPVPDGDTGTNMFLTVSNGVKAALKEDTEHCGKILKSLSRGLLMGARGNSGVITSQIFRGIYQELQDNETIDASQLAHALVNGSRVAYKAVMRPVEGTILTVVREAADYTYAYTVTQEITDCELVMAKMVEECNEALLRTPELLPVLKEVGVVDSGGKGLTVIFEGMLEAMKGHVVVEQKSAQAVEASQTKVEGQEEEFGFCTEFILKLSQTGMKHFSESDFSNELATIGNSIVCVQDEDIVKVHVHTLEPFTAIKMGKRRGRFLKLKVENMQQQHDNILEKEQEEVVAEKKKYGIITVAPGSGIGEMFKELRADIVIGGGQTMNPSTEDFVSAIGKLNCEHIIILPNNSNIVMAATQAAQVCEDQDIHVLPAKTIPQGISACVMFNPEAEIDEIIADMEDAIANVKSGEVTYAIKDTTYEGMEIKKDEYMGILNRSIILSKPDCISATKALMDQMIDEDSELVTLIYGEDSNEQEAEEIAEYIESISDAEVSIYQGNQPVYPFIIGVE
ncbi:DAK2 domain-containing protein [Floccifex sp.]|uniref:DAK2 domain-containing protein n=1 Tax=Floccifex sp. TaxID=2815810 RepID=UPI002A749EAC|nr:DAK2 domain-containing protein [Floccifex sp.]MDD7281938.1 DAK2 domain-containing protein [Erysipelotrichaceae bacterium]MDY2958404.1 DAK2 domain-containing protein [Floccifex sp.]